MHLYEENKTRTSCINGPRDVLARVNGTTCIFLLLLLFYTSTSRSCFIQNAPCVIRTRLIFARINGPILSTNKPFYRYGGHIELIKECYRMPRGHEHISFVFSSSFRGIFSYSFLTSKHGTRIFFPITILF